MNLKETAIILIDLQKESNFGIENVDEVINNTKELLKVSREANIPIIYTRQINRADGIGLSKGEPLNNDGSPYYYNTNTNSIEIFDEIKPTDNDVVIDKKRWSAFYQTDLDLVLKSLGVKHLIIGGLVTDGCLMTSVFDAYFRDYDVHLIKDICATTNEGAHMSSLLIMANWIYNISIYDTDQIIKKITGEPYSAWIPTKADSLQFTTDNMKDMFSKLHTERKEFS